VHHGHILISGTRVADLLNLDYHKDRIALRGSAQEVFDLVHGQCACSKSLEDHHTFVHLFIPKEFSGPTSAYTEKER